MKTSWDWLKIGCNGVSWQPAKTARGDGGALTCIRWYYMTLTLSLAWSVPTLEWGMASNMVTTVMAMLTLMACDTSMPRLVKVMVKYRFGQQLNEGMFAALPRPNNQYVTSHTESNITIHRLLCYHAPTVNTGTHESFPPSIFLKCNRLSTFVQPTATFDKVGF